ncbi:hypothetical protein C0995_004884 [Termitomyces sp. Mi166|nr:hypothetical protein C0995_004884 [Termitomyces sp. Mi166\
MGSHQTNLKVELNGPKVSGEISLTCNAWQAENMDGYFAVTGHWIEETAPMQWELKSALVGFMQLCNAHNGEHLGQALFKLVDRISITHKEQSSLKRKEIWRTIQMKASVAKPIQLILDMKVWWSSTFWMLNRGDRNKEHINTFINELHWEETDSLKRNKIHMLKLDNKWTWVQSFMDLLIICTLSLLTLP